MRMKYDREGDVLDILIRDGQIHHAEDHGQVIINYDDESRASELFPPSVKFNKTSLLFVDEPRRCVVESSTVAPNGAGNEKAQDEGSLRSP